jgi:hypothetical protein
MKLSEVKNSLKGITNLQFKLTNGTFVPEHFHVTEVGMITKNFIDCGGIIRNENVANFQLWSAEDHDHKLAPKKLNDIIELSEKVLGMEDLEVEVEYQGETIGKYSLDFDGKNFVLNNKFTDCLAKDNCGIPADKLKVGLATSEVEACTPGVGCC